MSHTTYSDGLSHGWTDCKQQLLDRIEQAEARGDDPREILELIKLWSQS